LSCVGYNVIERSPKRADRSTLLTGEFDHITER